MLNAGQHYGRICPMACTFTLSGSAIAGHLWAWHYQSDCIRDHCSHRHPAAGRPELDLGREARDVSKISSQAEEHCPGQRRGPGQLWASRSTRFLGFRRRITRARISRRCLIADPGGVNETSINPPTQRARGKRLRDSHQRWSRLCWLIHRWRASAAPERL